ncbi:MAG: hypothetical protein JWP00_4853 [Chloroflexi bacterium]|jgi:hypothetical protein|nr:hypothetical protein [Chloroflexota bacterium]
MLVVKQVEAAGENELAYECFNNGQRVGRLVARLAPDGLLEASLEQTVQREAGRTLVAKLERDAQAHGLAGLYVLPRDEKERDTFVPAGYEPVEEAGLKLVKRFDPA